MKKKILLQIDHDEHCSSFDSIVAIDASVDQLLRFNSVTPLQMESLVHGSIFTRGPRDLHRTALFFGGSNVEKSTELFEQAQKHLFGPLRVSMMVDPNGCNTTAVAAVLCVTRIAPLTDQKVAVLAATGPVGQRICGLCSKSGATVTVCSRSMDRAQKICRLLPSKSGTRLLAAETKTAREAAEVTAESDIVFAAGAAGIELLGSTWLTDNKNTRIVVDINAVPPHGVSGIVPSDNGVERHGKICFGAIGVGNLKMKIHKRSIEQLFESNDSILDTDQIFGIGTELMSPSNE